MDARRLDRQFAEQVIEVPTVSCSSCALLVPQTAEQLVDVPTVLSVAVLQQRTAEQIIDILVPGRDPTVAGRRAFLTLWRWR